ncbi:dienelactone hydrolase family protein [Sneathiella glossodoripedis]|uniref:dienelactone hydrolase family protein n=1 Tax=Sneathiella glossodoripedis TaxID=418853 RepID=UPI0004715141|nr:dienelactone hydrolase family protein [Sneathiella glossodoripedis]
MGKKVRLTAEDGHQLDAYLCEAQGECKGAIVLVQEIFGVNSHIRSVAERFAELGYRTIAPALFDRLEPNVELAYDADGVAKGREFKDRIADEIALKDIAAAADYVDTGPKVSVIGYCWGGKLAYLAAGKIKNLFKAVGYYGGGIVGVMEQNPQIPTLLHFGDQDSAIPMSEVEAIIARHPEVEVHVYSAGHGFNCDARGSYNKEAADLALKRSLDFLQGT